MIDDEVMRVTCNGCPSCGRLLVERNTSDGWVSYCLNGCENQLVVTAIERVKLE